MEKLEKKILINEAVVRGVAIQTLLLTLITIYTGSLIPLFILVVDFFIRAFVWPQLSLLALISRKAVAPLFRFKKKMINSQPKRFAATIGFMMTLAALVLNYLNFSLISIIVLSILALFSALEGFLSFCAGCKIFGFLIKTGLVHEDLCNDCSINGESE